MMSVGNLVNGFYASCAAQLINTLERGTTARLHYILCYGFVLIYTKKQYKNIS